MYFIYIATQYVDVERLKRDGRITNSVRLQKIAGVRPLVRQDGPGSAMPQTQPPPPVKISLTGTQSDDLPTEASTSRDKAVICSIKSTRVVEYLSTLAIAIAVPAFYHSSHPFPRSCIFHTPSQVAT